MGRGDELFRAEAYTPFEDQFEMVDGSDVFDWISKDYNQIGMFAGSQGTDAVFAAQVPSRILGVNLNCVLRRKSRLNKQFEITPIAEPRQNGAIRGGVSACHQQPASRRKGTFKLHLLLERSRPD